MASCSIAVMENEVETNVQQKGKRKKTTWGHTGFSRQVLAKAIAISTLRTSGAERAVFEICFAQESFWHKLRDIRYVSMITCVSKTTRNILQPSGNMLPFWGVWTRALRKHRWQEFHLLMNVWKNDCKKIVEFAGMPPGRIMAGKEYDLHDVWKYQVQENGGVEGYGKSIRRNRSNRESMFHRQVTFALSMLRAGQVPLERKPWVDKREEAKMAKQRMIAVESQILIREFADTVHSKGGIPESAFWLVSPEPFLEERAKNVWELFSNVRTMCRSYFPPAEYNDRQTRKVVRCMAVMNFCLDKVHMDRISDLVDGKDIMKHSLEARLQEVRVHAYRICRNMHIWFRSGALSLLLLTINGGHKVARSNSLATFELLQQYDSYKNIMRDITDNIARTHSLYNSPAADRPDFHLEWNPSGIMCKQGDFVLLHNAIKAAVDTL